MAKVLRWYRGVKYSSSHSSLIRETELCFTITLTEGHELNKQESSALRWLLEETFHHVPSRNGGSDSAREFSTESSLLKCEDFTSFVAEVSPLANFVSPWTGNALAVCRACGIHSVKSIERSIRYLVGCSNEKHASSLLDTLYDPMTERMRRVAYCQVDESQDVPYALPSPTTCEPIATVPLLSGSVNLLVAVNKELGLSLDEVDCNLYMNVFRELGRNPTVVELFDLGQSNSEHSRHWFFYGRLVIDDIEMSSSLMQLVKSTLAANRNNSTLAFCDNSSAIKGFIKSTLVPSKIGPSLLLEKQVEYDVIFTAETHNFPTGVAPRPGAETGIGGRLRDVHATGRGAHVCAGTAGYCVGNLQIPGYDLPWESKTYSYPTNIASPLKIELDASNGASDYGNKFGEPIIQGFTRSFGLQTCLGERREWVKPIMFTGGIGHMDSLHRIKQEPEKGMLVVKIGGPAYRIGMGGGAASSRVSSSSTSSELDFNAVQRGDAEMEQKLHRAIKACIELGPDNPIVSIHDQGAGGSGNVIKEIVSPAGASIDIRKFVSGDPTLSVMELWGAEYQEQDALLIRQENRELLEKICSREGVPCAIVGVVTGDGRIVVHDSSAPPDSTRATITPVDLPLNRVLGKMPCKEFRDTRIQPVLKPLNLPPSPTVFGALHQVLRLLSVGSKQFLTSKVDRSVSGLVAQQQCVGPLQLPLADVAVVAYSMVGESCFGTVGSATAIGEQPIKGLVNPSAMARLAVTEALTNLVWANVTDLKDIKCSANWMWPAKMPGEGATMYDAAKAMTEFMISLGIAVDGGKDSLSMVAPVPGTMVSTGVSTGVSTVVNTEMVKAPGSLVISAYVTVADVNFTVTPDLKRPGESLLVLLSIGDGALGGTATKGRLGGSALAQVYSQIGDDCPDVSSPALLARTFDYVQTMISNGLVLSGHDVSDGGLITTVLGTKRVFVPLHHAADAMTILFAEEPALVMEIAEKDFPLVSRYCTHEGVIFTVIGHTKPEKTVSVSIGDVTVLEEVSMPDLRAVWCETSYRLELLQTNPTCAAEEYQDLQTRKGLSFQCIGSDLKVDIDEQLITSFTNPAVAVLREEGSNGDREMHAAFYMAGFDVYDVTMSDLRAGTFTLSKVKGLAFVGGFSFGDVMGSAKGWAGVIKFNDRVLAEIKAFYARSDTFSLGVCNGCQLMTLLGIVPGPLVDFKAQAPGIPLLKDTEQPRFIHNTSGRFESRFSAVRILHGPSIMLKGLEGSTLGIWSAHGEGHVHFPEKSVLQTVLKKDLAPIRYVDDNRMITERYPYNPNGSVRGIAALCSEDGRHLAMMPHPERSFLKWQWAYSPPWTTSASTESAPSTPSTPWLKMFENARRFCTNAE